MCHFLHRKLKSFSVIFSLFVEKQLLIFSRLLWNRTAPSFKDVDFWLEEDEFLPTSFFFKSYSLIHQKVTSKACQNKDEGIFILPSYSCALSIKKHGRIIAIASNLCIGPLRTLKAYISATRDDNFILLVFD